MIRLGQDDVCSYNVCVCVCVCVCATRLRAWPACAAEVTTVCLDSISNRLQQWVADREIACLRSECAAHVPTSSYVI